MLKTRITLRNFSLVLLNLIKRLILYLQCLKTPPPPNVRAMNIHIFSLVHQFRLILALTCFPLPYLFGVWLVSWCMFSTVKSLFTGRLRIVLGFAILTTFHLISESLLGNTHFTMAILQKCCTVSSKTSTILFALFFLEFIFSFNASCVSRKFTSYSCLHPSRKWLLMRFILSVVFDRTVRFLTTDDVVVEEYNNCPTNNKWLDIKHVSIVFC